MALSALQSQETRGTLPKDWDAELVRQVLTAEPSSSQYPYVPLLIFYRCEEQKNASAANNHLVNSLATSAKSRKALRKNLR